MSILISLQNTSVYTFMMSKFCQPFLEMFLSGHYNFSVNDICTSIHVHVFTCVLNCKKSSKVFAIHPIFLHSECFSSRDLTTVQKASQLLTASPVLGTPPGLSVKRKLAFKCENTGNTSDNNACWD